MPRILFTRTPSEAEGGPGHPFREGTVHELHPRSFRRWLDMEAGVPAPLPAAAPAAVPAAVDHQAEGVAPEGVATEGDAASGGALVAETVEAVEAGGEAPPIIAVRRRPGGRVLGS